MLKMVFGRSGYGKTEYVFNSIKKLTQQKSENILLITPEQYSLISERRLLLELGEAGVCAVDNSSFSRISNAVKREYGGECLTSLSKGSKAVLMMQAIEKSRDNLCLFGKNIDSSAFVESMVKIYDEMKSCNLGAVQIGELSKNIQNETLFRKLADISLIMSIYEAIIENRFLDSADELTRLYERIKDKNYFVGKTVFIDGFNGFVAQEYKLLELIIRESEAVTITLCTDSFECNDRFNLFTYVNDSAKILRKIALKAGVNCETVLLDKNYRAKNDDILNLEKNLFSENTELSKSANSSISIYSSKNITDECCETARKIRNLLRNGCKASDITVITRDIEKYREELGSAFRKYEIPFFNDERQPIKCQPLVVFIEYLLRCVNYSFKSDDILSIAKTGLTDIHADDINVLENYIYLWNINGMKWTKTFENSTRGFVSEISDSDQKQLDALNLTRERLITPIIDFKTAVKNADAKKICEHIYKALIKFKADEMIKKSAVELAASGSYSLAVEQGMIWDMVMDILDQLVNVLGDEVITLKNFAKLFSVVISCEDLGTLPGGIDNVQIGQADRIRTDNPKAVFVLGANEGEFPQAVTGGGLLSESDRKILLDNDFKLYSYGEILNLQERYFAYMACSAPSKMLYISYLGNSGKENAPSEIITSIKSIFTDIKEYSYSDISDIDLVETKQNAFELMSERYLENSQFSSSLKKYFENDDRYFSIKSLAENNTSKINSTDTAVSLFGYNMYISASRIEDFYNCSFRYFCKFGLGAKPRKKAELDPMQRGTLIHFVLEMIMADYGSKKLSAMTDLQIKSAVDKYTADYFENQMGNIADLSIRFKYNYKRLSKLIFSVVKHLAIEFSDCDFEAKAFELKIDRDAQVKPEVLTLDDGSSIQVRGSIDRVDIYEKDNQKYVRVVDYKSGNKTFRLSDIMYGLNLQMFIYLFALSEDKTSPYCGIPSGVLYMHASRSIFPFDSGKEAIGSIEAEETSSYKMKGLVLSDFDGEIAVAMENSLAGKHINVKMNKSGELTGQLANLQELGLIHKKINSLIAQMGMELHLGKINRNPVKSKDRKLTCDFCDYSDVCANMKSIENRIIPDLTDDEVKEILSKEYVDNATVD